MVGFLRRFISSVKDDDDSDWLSRFLTVGLLVVLAAITMVRHDPTTAISCWTPAHFTGAMISYTNRQCWVSSEYYLPTSPDQNRAPQQPGVDSETESEYAYYRWVPMLLMLQAFMFYLPRMIWKTFRNKTPASLTEILQTTSSLETAEGQRRQDTVTCLARHVGSFMARPGESGITGAIRNNLNVLSFFTKLLYFVNVLVQICVINWYVGRPHWQKFVEFLDPDRTSQIFGRLDEILGKVGVNDSVPALFPQNTLCDFNIRILGNIQRYTVQCSLLINDWHLRMYVFIWYWMLIVILATSVSIFFHLLASPIMPCVRRRYIKMYLQIAGKWDGNYGKLHRFSSSYMRQDGIFVLRLISRNSDEVTVTKIISYLWDNFEDSHRDDGSKQKYAWYPMVAPAPVAGFAPIPAQASGLYALSNQAPTLPTAPKQSDLYPHLGTDVVTKETV